MAYRVVLDTSAIVAYFSKDSPTSTIWRSLLEGKYLLCVSNDILWEYQEIIAQKTTPQITENVVNYLLNSPFVEMVTPHYHFELITADRDDNKFVDCAIAANATFIVSDDKHYLPLRQIEYPRLYVIRMMEFVSILKNML